MKIFDCFPFNDELEMLKCRIEELAPVVDAFVLVEATETHQGSPKPSHFKENIVRFWPWMGRIYSREIPFAPGLDAWGRDRAQREELREMLEDAGASPNDLVLLSDVDEIPCPDLVASLRSDPPIHGMVSFEQRFCPFAVDWEHPEKWAGTTAALFRDVKGLNAMRDARGQQARVLRDAGFHFSWLGGPGATHRKLHSFAHPEIIATKDEWVRSGAGYLDGYHVDGVKLRPINVDESFPRYIRERRCPESWFRPRS